MTPVGRYLDAATLQELSHLQLTARRVVEGSSLGLHRSALKGSSVEFRHSRAYTPGDDPRRLDWRVLARTDRPFVKQYDQESNLRCLIVVDGSGSMGCQNKFDYAARAAAVLAYLMLASAEAVGVAVAGDGLRGYVPPRGGPGQLSRVVEQLDRTRPTGPGNFDSAAAAVCDRLGRRALVIWLGDFFFEVPAIRSGLARLRHRKHELIGLRVIHPSEASFPFGSWSRFTGLESERSRTLDPTLVRSEYLTRFQRHARDLTAAARAAGADVHVLPTDRPVVESVRRVLDRRTP